MTPQDRPRRSPGTHSNSHALILAALVLMLPPAFAEAADPQDLIDRLGRNGPSDPDSPGRMEVLMNIDSLFMNDSYETLRVVLNRMLSDALWEISGSASTRPAVWYVWNMGYVARAGGYILGFDLGEVELDPLTEDQKKILAESLDILFISHVDGPHVDKDLVSLMREDAYVVCPEQVVDTFDPILDRKAQVIGMEVNETKTIGSVKVEAFPGDDRRGTPMRCFMVSVGGLRILQTGDQHYVAEWMRGLPRIDALLMGPLEEDDWVVEAVDVIGARAMVPGGIYDMSHPKDTWDGYPWAYMIADRSRSSVVPLFFGEQLSLTKAGGALPPYQVLAIGAVLACGVVLAGVYYLKRDGGKKDKREVMRRPAPRCEKRYVKKLCLTCKHYAIRGGQPYCSKYNFKLDTEE